MCRRGVIAPDSTGVVFIVHDLSNENVVARLPQCFVTSIDGRYIHRSQSDLGKDEIPNGYGCSIQPHISRVEHRRQSKPEDKDCHGGHQDLLDNVLKHNILLWLRDKQDVHLYILILFLYEIIEYSIFLFFDGKPCAVKVARTVWVGGKSQVDYLSTSFQHAVSQWLYFSKGTELTPGKFPGGEIDGWIINVLTEKNKCASSKNQISVIFDKRTGINKFWTEFYFISAYTPSEVKLQRDGCKPFMDLCCTTNGSYTVLTVTNPETGEIEYQSKGFYKKNARVLYDEDPEFHKWFDVAVDYSCRERISKGLLKINVNKNNFNTINNDSVDDSNNITLDPIAEAINNRIQVDE